MITFENTWCFCRVELSNDRTAEPYHPPKKPALWGPPAVQTGLWEGRTEFQCCHHRSQFQGNCARPLPSPLQVPDLNVVRPLDPPWASIPSSVKWEYFNLSHLVIRIKHENKSCFKRWVNNKCLVIPCSSFLSLNFHHSFISALNRVVKLLGIKIT